MSININLMIITKLLLSAKLYYFLKQLCICIKTCLFIEEVQTLLQHLTDNLGKKYLKANHTYEFTNNIKFAGTK